MQKLINFDNLAKENVKEDNANWLQIHDHPCRILIIGGSGSGRTYSLFHLISHQHDIDKIYLIVKDKLLINKWESTGLKHLNDFKGSVEYSNDIKDVYENIEEHNQIKKQKTLTVFDDMIANMLSN